MKRTLLTFMLAIGMTANIWADTVIEGFKYTLNDDFTATVTGLDDPSFTGMITIPETIKYYGTTYQITQIGENAFSDYKFKSVVISNSVTSIGSYAFYNCTGLTSVTIGNSVTSIGNYAFRECTGLTSIDIPNSVDSISSYTFYGCTGLTSVNIPNSVTSIGRSAFNKCTGLTAVDIPNSVTSIGGYAFGGCSSLTSVTIGNSVTSIGVSAFRECTGLTAVDIPNSVTSIGRSAFYDCTGLTSVNIPNTVDSISSHTFYGCTGLTAVDIPNSVTSIGYAAFSKCIGLTSVTIGNSVTSIGDYAFWGCTGLTSVNIPNTVDSISSYTFYGCTGLTAVDIPNSVTSIGGYAFGGCSSLTSVTIGNSVTSIGVSAFRECTGLTSVTIPNSVTSIGPSAFSKCTGLISVNIPNTVDSISSYTFYGCTGLTAVTIGNSVTSIGRAAFYDCTGLTAVDIPNSVTSIGRSAFNKCTGLTAVTIGNSVTSIGDYAFWGCTGLTSVNIPNTVDSISSYTFYGCTGLTAVDIPNSVTSIGRSAFNKCTGLTSVTIGNSVTSIGEWAFESCTGLTSVTIPNSVTSIKRSAFYNCTGLTSVIIPNSVTSIGEWVFESCTGMTDIYCHIEEPWTISSNVFYDVPTSTCILHVPIGSKEIYEITNVWKDFLNIIEDLPTSSFTIGNLRYTIMSDSTVKVSKAGTPAGELMIPESVEYEGKQYSVTRIGMYAFRDCSGLTSITIPNSVTSIGEYAFSNCSGLTSVTIPNSVDSISSYVFYGCTGLTKLYCYINRIQGAKMDAIIQTLPVSNGGRLYLIYNETSQEGNIISDDQITNAQKKGWDIYYYENGQWNKITTDGKQDINDLLGDYTFYYGASGTTTMDCQLVKTSSGYGLKFTGTPEGTIPVTISLDNSTIKIENTQFVGDWKTASVTTDQAIVLLMYTNGSSVYRTASTTSVGLEGTLSIDSETAEVVWTMKGTAPSGYSFYTLRVANTSAGTYASITNTNISAWNYPVKLVKKKEVILLNEENFPDNNFRASLSTLLSINEDDEITPEMIDATTLLNLSDKTISNLSGIKNFTELETLYCQLNQIKGADMDNLIEELPTRTPASASPVGMKKVRNTWGALYVYDNTTGNEGNVISTEQLVTANAKGWKVYQFNGTAWEEYAGSTTDINYLHIDRNTVESYYTIDGKALNGKPTKAGIYIKNGKKVLIK